jgi:hypothetical protein
VQPRLENARLAAVSLEELEQGRETERPARMLPSRLGTKGTLTASPLAGSLSLFPPASPGQGRGLVRQRPLTCWQSEPQRLVKRRCHGHAAHRQRRGFLADFLLAQKAATRIRPCKDVRDEIGLCTHSTWSCFVHDASRLGSPGHSIPASPRAAEAEATLHYRYTDFGIRQQKEEGSASMANLLRRGS